MGWIQCPQQPLSIALSTPFCSPGILSEARLFIVHCALSGNTYSFEGSPGNNPSSPLFTGDRTAWQTLTYVILRKRLRLWVNQAVPPWLSTGYPFHWAVEIQQDMVEQVCNAWHQGRAEEVPTVVTLITIQPFTSWFLNRWQSTLRERRQSLLALHRAGTSETKSRLSLVFSPRAPLYMAISLFLFFHS